MITVDRDKMADEHVVGDIPPRNPRTCDRRCDQCGEFMIGIMNCESPARKVCRVCYGYMFGETKEK